MINEIIQGDALEILPKIPDNYVDMVFTDPPWMISSSLKIRRQRNPMKFCKFRGKDINYEFGDWDIFKNMDDYLKFTESWFEECIRVLKKGGHILTFFDKHKLSFLVQWAENMNVKSRQCLFWIKSNPVPQARKVAFMSAIELCYWGTKETTTRKFATFNYQLGQHPDYIICPICSGHERHDFGFHPTQKPLKVIKWIIEYLSNKNDIILDPFIGSGTTAVACIKLNRRFIGIDLDTSIAKKRISKVQQEIF